MRAAAAQPTVGSGRVRAVLGRTSVQAALIFLLLLGAYLSNGDILPGNDATANVRLAGKLVTQHKLVFTPEEDPVLFEWHVKMPEGEGHAHFRYWESPYKGEPVRRALERGDLSKPEPYYFLMKTRYPGVYANRYGLGAGLFAAPFVAAVYPFARDLYQRPSAGLLWYAAKLAASCAVAASAVLLFLAGLPYLRPGTAAGLALAYGLGTCAWSVSSQTLWQHGPTEFFLALGTYFFLRRERPASAFWVGLSYTLAFACRPTAAVAGAVAGIAYLIRDRRALVRCLVGGLPVAVLLAAYNLHYFGTAVVLGQLGGATALLPFPPAALAAGDTVAAARSAFGSSLLSGIGGSLLSPSRGLLVFSPVAAFAFWGLVRVWRDERFSALRATSLASLAMGLVAASWYGWWGGWCYGYRLFTDTVTLLAFLAIPIAESVRRRRALAAAFSLCLAWSVVVQGLGAFAYDVVGWNNRELFAVRVPGHEYPLLFTDANEARREAWARGGSIDRHKVDVNSRAGHTRLWSLRDSQILYYFEHFSEARRFKRVAVEQFLTDNG